MTSTFSKISKLKQKHVTSRLDESRHNLSAITHPYPTPLKPSCRWSRNLKLIRENIHQFSNDMEAIQFAQTPKLSGFDHGRAMDANGDFVQKNYQALLTTHPQFSDAILGLEASEVAHPEICQSYQEKSITNTLLFSANYIFECLKHTQPDVVCEIGGGYGGVAYAWLTNKVHTPSVYIDIDYPECLFFAELYLKYSLPEANFIYIDSPEKLKSINLEENKKTVILCPLQFADILKNTSIDLIINSGSLQEMDEKAVDFWMDWVDESNATYFCSSNYFCQPITNLAQSTNMCAPRLAQNWHCSYKMDYEMPIYILQSTHEFALIFAKRQFIDEHEKNKNEAYFWNNISNKSLFSRKDLLMAMDIVRITQNVKIAFETLRSLVKNGVTYADASNPLDYPINNTPYIPKEALYICCWLLEHMKTFSESEINELQHIQSKLDMMYKAAPKGTQ